MNMRSPYALDVTKAWFTDWWPSGLDQHSLGTIAKMCMTAGATLAVVLQQCSVLRTGIAD